jgi:hypothetical protein
VANASVASAAGVTAEVLQAVSSTTTTMIDIIIDTIFFFIFSPLHNKFYCFEIAHSFYFAYVTSSKDWSK